LPSQRGHPRLDSQIREQSAAAARAAGPDAPCRVLADDPSGCDEYGKCKRTQYVGLDPTDLEPGPGTVKIHLAAICRRLNAHKRTEAVVLAGELNL
jgi:hypothetical protein